jgi:UDP-sulfoquinovose synthase
MDVSSPAIGGLIQELAPELVYHLAQACSAPWSMKNVEQAVQTLVNNEAGNMRVLWALKSTCPEAHLVKLGTFGEYAKGGIEIAEGYFQPSWKGQTASCLMPYPRASDDVYHTSKINDTNYISLACRKWGLRVTDVMQSTIFGVFTEEIKDNPALYTRFDYDAVWGTVVNRFTAQTILQQPMTIYGTGLQRSGLMALSDAVGSLAQLAWHTPLSGEHKVINHVTERSWCINEIAEEVGKIARASGYEPRIDRSHNPRQENDAEKACYEIETRYVASHVAHTPFTEVLKGMFETVARFKHRIRPEVFAPTIRFDR